MSISLLQQLGDEILLARGRVYDLRGPTPLDELHADHGETLFLKREDLPPMHAYKWRGAYNRIASLPPEVTGVVAASAGNHAQGVALAAARRPHCHAKIFMPQNTPQLKQEAVTRLGGESVTIVLHGDRFDEALRAALECSQEEERILIHPYDDLAVMGGQGTIADEIVMSGKAPFDAAYLQIGGGGMAAGVGAWLKRYYPDIRIYGVEGRDQASMAAAARAGKPVDLDYLDVFCDGTAVRRAGELTFQVCREVVDEFLTVTNEEVCAGMQYLWDQRRLITEPAGAMGLAAWLKHREEHRHDRVLVILCGANMDFAQLNRIVRDARIGSATRRYLRFTIEEKAGTLLHLLHELRTRANIVEFQYGKTHEDLAYPVIGFDIFDEPYADLLESWRERGIEFEDVTGATDVQFRSIAFRDEQFTRPYFVEVEFPERAGALADFLSGADEHATIVYFNYQYSGERVGRALVGFDFDSTESRASFVEFCGSGRNRVRSVRALDEATTARLLGRG